MAARKRPSKASGRPTIATLARDVEALLKGYAALSERVASLEGKHDTLSGRVSARLSKPPPKP